MQISSPQQTILCGMNFSQSTALSTSSLAIDACQCDEPRVENSAANNVSCISKERKKCAQGRVSGF